MPGLGFAPRGGGRERRTPHGGVTLATLYVYGSNVHETVQVPISDLLLDVENARLGEEQPSQQQAYLSLATQQGRRLVTLARDIVENGLDPITLPAVVATGDRRRRYRVVEGNRRVLALKALETPSIVSGALATADQKALTALSARYLENPIDEITCVLFETQTEAEHWVRLRHTGANEGAGLVEWNSDERDRYLARHGAGRGRTLGGQALDFIRRLDGNDAAHGAKIVTNLDRLMKSRAVRQALGLDKDAQDLVSRYPAEELLKPLRKIVDDLSTKRIKVKDIYDEDDRASYLQTFSAAELPDQAKVVSDPVALGDLELGKPAPKPKPKPKPKPRPKPTQRTTLIPSGVRLNPQPPRINAIYNELLTLNVDLLPNAAAVLLRVFVELSVDHYIGQHSIAVKGDAPLAARLKATTKHLEDAGKIPAQLHKVIDRIAGTQQTVLAASTVTWNQYVHNVFAFPKPQELYAQWDELQPFMEKVWA